MREYSKASMTSSAPRKPQEQGGALAEALRRAAEKNGRGKAGRQSALPSVASSFETPLRALSG
jgi:hypothetical protein